MKPVTDAGKARKVFDCKRKAERDVWEPYFIFDDAELVCGPMFGSLAHSAE